MKTSNQLTKEFSCANNNGATATKREDFIVKAQAEKEVLKMVLEGEIPNDLESIKGALISSLEDRDIVFENRHQQEDQIILWTNRIKRYATWEQRDLIFPEREEVEEGQDAALLLPNAAGDMVNTDVEMFGEQVRVLPDFITRNGNVVTVGKIKTGRAPKERSEDTDLMEVYAYGLLGKKLYPDARVEVEIEHLGDSSQKAERVLMNLPFMPDEETAKEALHTVREPYKPKVTEIPFTPELVRSFEEKHEAELSDNEIEVNEDCASCPKFNVCNYVEPPMAMDIEVAVRPINEIHLTEEQTEAVNYRHGTVRINAGAGAGKTLVVAWRVKEMLKEGILPEEICLITFTNAGADEMKARVINYCEAEGIEFDHDKLTMTTFNAFCQQVIDGHYEELGFTRPPRIIPEEIRMDRINQILSRYPKISTFHYNSGGQYDKYRALYAAKEFFRVIKERGYTRTENPWEGSENFSGVWDNDLNMAVKLTETDKDLLFQMYEDFDRSIKAENKIEYPDQMNLVRKLLTMEPRLFDEIGFKHIIVDEFQDTDYPQIELLQKMKDASSFESLMCVGDDSQAIFSFRHTSPEYIINFAKYLGDGNEAVGYRCDNINLMENHRSTANIIDFANSINALNENRVDKELIATKGYADPVHVEGFYSQHQEYKAVAEKIKADIDAGEKPYDIAFLAYTKKELQALGSELTKLGIPSIMMVNLPYLDNSNCAAAQTFFDSFAYHTTQGAMDYINALGHGSLMAETADEIARQVDTLMTELDSEETSRDRFIEYVKALDPDNRDECLQSFIKEKLEPCENMEELKDLFRTMKLYGKDSLFKRQDRYNGVCLSTIHSAKGLEWDKVYYSVDSLDKEKFHKSINRAKFTGEIEELNRMHFVAASRAKSDCTCVGRYVLNDTLASGMPENTALKNAFTILGQPMVYQPSMVRTIKAQERAEAKREREEGRDDTVRRTIPRITPLDLYEYRRLTDGAQQITMADLEEGR